ncbi:MAG: hypothetical protein IK077_05920 [Thermoguttaceae bacterium]|nr:hypothetical protein [Thermoguttaceae bacterium]
MLKPGLRYSHIGIPVKDRDLPIYLEACKVHINDFNDHPYAVEWLKFEEGSPFPEILQKQAHIAYECDDLEEAMKGLKVLVEPFDAAPGLKCAFVEADGLGIELMQRF